MLVNNPRWNAIKRWASWAAANVQIETVATSVLFPIIECVFVNLLTGAKAGEGAPFAAGLIAIAVVHGGLILLLLLRQGLNPVQTTALVLELEERLEQARRESDEKTRRLEQEAHNCATKIENELARKNDAYRLMRTVLETLNLQTCQLNPTAPGAFRIGLLPIIQKVAASAQKVLGVKSEHFTIEIYCLDYCIKGPQDEGFDQCVGEYVGLGLFYSSSGVDSQGLNLMNAGSPYQWGWNRGIAGTCCISEDKLMFYCGDTPKPDLHFRNFATVPIPEVCSPQVNIGLVVVTSMQAEPFDRETLETMQFLASVVSQYISSHLRCLNDWKAEQTRKQEDEKKEEERKKREERKAAREAAKSAAGDHDPQGPQQEPLPPTEHRPMD